MATLCGIAGSRFHRCSRIIFSNLELSYARRNFGGSSISGQQAAAVNSASGVEIVIPKKKTWNKLAVLQALCSTVGTDPTASHYIFQDDPYLAPRSSAEFKLYSLSQESGKNAAQYIVSTYPKFFQKDYAEPHIPCLMPRTMEPLIEGVSEEALVERILLRRVSAAVHMYDQLLQAGTTVSIDVTNKLLDLICFYGDQDPVRANQPEKEVADEVEEVQDEARRRRGRGQRGLDLLDLVWREKNNAERIFNLMPERNEHSYCALIKGMVKHGAYTKAFDLYTDMLNRRMTADVHTFNALITAAPEVRQKYSEKWDLIVETLRQMDEQKVKPSLLTFNHVLRSVRRCGPMGRTQVLQALSEMKALGIEPSLATYNHVLVIFYRPVASARARTEILHEVMDEISGKSFVARDPDDVQFFSNAMRICLDLKDVELAYRVQRLLGEGDNWRLLGDSSQQSYYYGRFFNLLCLMEHVDVVLKWYRDLVPSLFYPNSQAMRDLLQALDTDNRLDLIPEIWKEIKKRGHANRAELVEDVLALMAREKHSPEVQESFAECALEVKEEYSRGTQSRMPLEWTASALAHLTSILLAAERLTPAWEVLKLFKTHNRVPAEALLEEFVTCAKTCGRPHEAVGLVHLSFSYNLPVTTRLVHRVAQEFDLSDEQRKSLAEMNVMSDSDSDSDSSKD